MTVLGIVVVGSIPAAPIIKQVLVVQKSIIMQLNDSLGNIFLAIKKNKPNRLLVFKYYKKIIGKTPRIMGRVDDIYHTKSYPEEVILKFNQFIRIFRKETNNAFFLFSIHFGQKFNRRPIIFFLTNAEKTDSELETIWRKILFGYEYEEWEKAGKKYYSLYKRWGRLCDLMQPWYLRTSLIEPTFQMFESQEYDYLLQLRAIEFILEIGYDRPYPLTLRNTSSSNDRQLMEAIIDLDTKESKLLFITRATWPHIDNLAKLLIRDGTLFELIEPLYPSSIKPEYAHFKEFLNLIIKTSKAHLIVFEDLYRGPHMFLFTTNYRNDLENIWCDIIKTKYNEKLIRRYNPHGYPYNFQDTLWNVLRYVKNREQVISHEDFEVNEQLNRIIDAFNPPLIV
jgi:hypothetical protein